MIFKKLSLGKRIEDLSLLDGFIAYAAFAFAGT
jgi:hypothetical protein